jgi:hypothetical protein
VIEKNRPPTGEDGDLRAALAGLDPKARDTFRRVLIHDEADRDAIAAQLLRYRDERGSRADIVDMLTMYRRRDEGSAGARGDRSARGHVWRAKGDSG